jgi:hypothetical protein
MTTIRWEQSFGLSGSVVLAADADDDVSAVTAADG